MRRGQCKKTLVTIHFKGQAADAHLVEVFSFYNSALHPTERMKRELQTERDRLPHNPVFREQGSVNFEKPSYFYQRGNP